MKQSKVMNCEIAQRAIALISLTPGANGQSSTRGWDAWDPLNPGSSRAGYSRSWGTEPDDLPGLEHPVAGCRGTGFSRTDFSGADFSGTGRVGSVDALQAWGAGSPGEVSEEERLALEAHLAGCQHCRAEMAATAALYRALLQAGDQEPSASLLAGARLRLDTTLDRDAHRGSVAHLLQRLSFGAGRLRASSGQASALLLLGLTVGGYGGYQAGQHAHNIEQGQVFETPAERPPAIADVISIKREPDSEFVEVQYHRLVPDAFSGSLDDPSIRRLLVFAMDNGVDPSVSHNSLDLLATECRHGHACNGGPVRAALLHALHLDRRPQVRLEALDGLEPYIGEDMQVRDAVVRAMLSDSSAAVRSEAIRLLTPVEVDSSVRQALHSVASNDGDPSIRTASLEVLRAMPQLQ